MIVPQSMNSAMNSVDQWTAKFATRSTTKKTATTVRVTNGLRCRIADLLCRCRSARTVRNAVVPHVRPGGIDTSEDTPSHSQSTALSSGIVGTTGHAGLMDLTQLVIVAVAVAGAVIVGLLAIVPTVLEFPRRRETTDRPAPPTALKPQGAGDSDDREHRLAA